MRTPEQKREAAQKFQAEHAGSGQKPLAWKFRDDIQDEIIPVNAPRNRGVKRFPLRQQLLKHSVAFSRHLVVEAKKDLPDLSWLEGVGSQPVVGRNAQLVVVDTNILTRGIGSNSLGYCSEIVRIVIHGDKIRPCVTKPLVKEYRNVIGRRRLPNGVEFNEKSDQTLTEFLARCSFLSGPLPKLNISVEDDPSDDILLITQALAREQQGKDCAIVTCDHHLLDLSDAPELDIMHPAIYLARLAAASPQSLFALNS